MGASVVAGFPDGNQDPHDYPNTESQYGEYEMEQMVRLSARRHHVFLTYLAEPPRYFLVHLNSKITDFHIWPTPHKKTSGCGNMDAMLMIPYG